MTECVLHIGVEKTGSTSIQFTLAKNRAKLLARGVLYPRAMGERNHVKAYAYASESGVDEVKSKWNLDSPAAIESFRLEVQEELIKELAAHPADIVCISNEHCSSRLLTGPEIGRLADLLGGLCSRVRVVAYLRPQGEALRSAYSTYVKTGGMKPFRAPNANEINRKYDYDAILARWAAAFGQENIEARIFERERLIGGDVVEDFLARLPVETKGLVLEQAANPSLGRIGVEFLRRLNALVPYTIECLANPLRGNIQDLVDQAADDVPFEGDPGVMDDLDQKMDESNERVKHRYFPAMEGPLFAPVRRNAKAPSAVELSPEILMLLIAKIWQA
ncbi:MAG: hypothetical protein M3Y22_02235, partial [Pseudomonadota bacterium]|nr:hypothetical protein [Pseudomonadota bacterium]